ncbi:MAG: nucleoside triphosphate pyrophosphohydrolase [Pacificimonas sp.]
MRDDARLSAAIIRLRDVMAALRDPNGGCPWDLEQNFETIAPYTIEEAYEVADAIRRDDMDELRGELGDLLFQSVYHAQLAAERGAFDLADVAEAITDKMVSRHPHVFGHEDVADAAAQTDNWEAMKAKERGSGSALDGVALALPALMRAEKIQKRAARVGFDWPDAEGPRAKIEEELSEFEAADGDAERVAEAGDVLFSVVNYLRHHGIDPEVALRGATDRFETRFRHVEASAGAALTSFDMDELDRLWRAAKAATNMVIPRGQSSS